MENYINKVIQGDCLEVMKGIPDNSVDSIVTDPPYELGFMGKSWDSTGIANNVDIWKECLRVLKPGGHLLSFGGTRTYHRMASAIEDAGFEVRDMIEWVYGCLSEDTEILTANGWKMLYSVFEGDYVFACDYKNDMKLQLEPVKQKFIYDYDEDAYHIKDTGYYGSELMETDHIVSRNHNVLVLESWIRNNGFGNNLYYEKIQAEKLYEYIKKTNGKQTFRIPGINGDIPCTIEKIPYKGKVWCVEVESGAFVARRNGKIFITGNSGFPKSLNISKAIEKMNGVEPLEKIPNEGQRFYGQEGSDYHPTPNRLVMPETQTEDGKKWEGWGTALKPSHESICMARKPLDRWWKIKDDGKKVMGRLMTVAENVLKWGTGGINIEQSRVFTQDDEVRKQKILAGEVVCNAFCDKHGLYPNSVYDILSFSQQQLLDFYQHIFSELGLNSISYKDLLHNLVEIDYKKCTQLLGVPYDCGHLVKNGDEYVSERQEFLSFQSYYPTLYRFYDEYTHRILICDQDVFPLNNDVQSDILRFLSSKENNLLDNNPRLVFFVVLIAYNLLVNNNLHNHYTTCKNKKQQGRFPANLILSADENGQVSEEVRECFPEQKSGTRSSKYKIGNEDGEMFNHGIYGKYKAKNYDDIPASSGNASRFFKSILYYPKASKSERNRGCEELPLQEKVFNGQSEKSSVDMKDVEKRFTTQPKQNNHPTVKPIALMEYLIKMVTPQCGVVLDPFMGSGSTGVACKKNGYSFIGIEREKGYCVIAEHRIKNVEKNLI